MSTQSDLELLSDALQQAMDSYSRGVIVGPALDEVQLGRSERRARRADERRVRTTRVTGSGVVA